MAFRRLESNQPLPESPEALFQDNKMRKVPGLLSHQADVIRTYCNDSLERPDVALQLPTGSGKTLVGLLITEWRRIVRKERILYLCPTNQLVHQVARQSDEYGIRALPFTGSSKEYSAESKALWLSNDAIGVTTYSALFNTNPFFQSPNVIVLDDAHAAESYIAEFWSLKIDRESHKPLFVAIMNILKPVISDSNWQLITSPSRPTSASFSVEKLPSPHLLSVASEIRSVLHAHCNRENKLGYPWEVIEQHLEVCHLYYTYDKILIRPLIAPTQSHEPFAGAQQRIYMSATPGLGGELERITGRRRIHRQPPPASWDKHGIGRRLFIFPERSISDRDEIDRLFAEIVRRFGRALFLVPSTLRLEAVRAALSQVTGIKVLTASDIEDSKKKFTESSPAAAVVANRYDGIDFPGEECRVLIVEGLSNATNLQESFFITRLAAKHLLTARITTRIVQAVGRCTRSPTDYAAVIILGDELTQHLVASESRSLFHPELQAEIDFGWKQSMQMKAKDFIENIQLLLARGDDWKSAENEIVSQRSKMKQLELPGAANLQSCVDSEIAYQEAIWAGDFTSAVNHAKAVLGKLTDPVMRGYRGLWLYLQGVAAWHIFQGGMARMGVVAKGLFKEAHSTSKTVRWLIELSKEDGDLAPNIKGLHTSQVIERFESQLEQLGNSHDGRFAQLEKVIMDGLIPKESPTFEDAHMRLGKLLGYDADKIEDTGSPDPYWIVDDTMCFVFEDHAGAKETSALDVTKARQAATHDNWMRANTPIRSDATIIKVLVTPVTKFDVNALPHLVDVKIWPLAHFRNWASDALGVVRQLRATFAGRGVLLWREEAMSKFEEYKLEPTSLLELLNSLQKR